MNALRFLTDAPPPLVLALGIGATIAAALVDLLTGAEIAALLLYVLPVGYVSWFGTRNAGVGLAVGAALTYLLERLVWIPVPGVPTLVINVLLLLSVLVSLALVLDGVHRAYLNSLRHAESKYTRIVEAAIEGIVATDSAWTISYVNRRAASLFGRSMEELRGVSLMDLAAGPAAHAALRERMHDDAGAAGPIEVPFARKEGDPFWALVTFTATRTVDGAQEGLVLLLTDISELKRSEAELDRRYREIAAMQRLAAGLSQSLDLSARLNNAVDTVLGIMGCECGCIYLLDEGGQELRLHSHRGLRSEEFPRIAARWPIGRGVTGGVAQTGNPVFIRDVADNPFFDHRIRDLEHVRGFAGVPLASGERVVGVMAIMHPLPLDFTPSEKMMLQTLGRQIGVSLENAYLTDMARERERQVRQLSIDLVQVQEEERRRFARELHDGLSQLLTTLRINTELALKHAAADPLATQRHLREVIALSAEAQTEAKEIAYNLRPAILDDFGLPAAIKVHVGSFERRTGIVVDLHLPPEEVRFSSIMETTIYRIIQELLTNVAKHAEATRVTMQLLLRNNIVALTVADNGRGFDVRRSLRPVDESPHYGLRNIRERVEFFAGMFRAESVPGAGTEIMIELPVGQPLAAQERKEHAL
jgi:PAS domain S-box-containing protein